jgi:hypothetical protein
MLMVPDCTPMAPALPTMPDPAEYHMLSAVKLSLFVPKVLPELLGIANVSVERVHVPALLLNVTTWGAVLIVAEGAPPVPNI